jgi:hypothetical protein
MHLFAAVVSVQTDNQVLIARKSCHRPRPICDRLADIVWPEAERQRMPTRNAVKVHIADQHAEPQPQTTIHQDHDPIE